MQMSVVMVLTPVSMALLVRSKEEITKKWPYMKENIELFHKSQVDTMDKFRE